MNDTTGYSADLLEVPIGKTKLVKRFAWSQVDPRVIRAMLAAAYASDGEEGDVRKVNRLVGEALNAQAALALGAPPAARVFSADMVDALRDTWLPLLDSESLGALTVAVQAGLDPTTRSRRFRSDAGRIEFLRERQRTHNLIRIFRSAFLRAHKVGVRRAVKSFSDEERAARIELVGCGVRARPLYQHQIDARARLDDLYRSKDPAGVVVLPTGAGKTDIVAGWVLDRLREDPTIRVLWLAHQQELLTQAVGRLSELASSYPKSFRRVARELHSEAGPSTLLGDDTLDVAAMTIQSLSVQWNRVKQNQVDAFLTRPTIVVVDEAHHAGAPSFDAVLAYICASRKVIALIGLTATPWPTSPLAWRRFDARFPTVVFKQSLEQLIAQSILARPVVTTVDTALQIELSAKEIGAAIHGDLAPETLQRLDNELRHLAVADTWLRQRDRWGKTLLFAPTIAQADRLAALLSKGHPAVKTLHSRTTNDRRAVLDWFRRANGPCVLVSVGMLTEGVDLPSARTAFLARPTTSRILLQQMIGRVLRGPRAGGALEAQVVYFKDRWRNFGETLEPPDVLPESTIVVSGAKGEEIRRLPPIVDDNDLEVPADVVAQIGRMYDVLSQRMYLDGDATNDVSIDPLLVATRLTGYYQLPERTIPVFDHQLAGFEELVARALTPGVNRTAFLSHFDDTPAPYPSPRALRDLVEYVKEQDEAPRFVSLDAAISPARCAQRITDSGPLTDEERGALMHSVFETDLARAVYTSFDRYAEAVECELRERRRRTARLGTEQVGAISTKSLPLLERYDRQLAPLMARVVDEARLIVPPEVLIRFGDLPEVGWTRRVIASAWGYWTIALHGKRAGHQTIRLNQLLRTRPKHVPDEVLEYLLYHELLHHLLPGQGHDAQFRDLESRWPNATSLDVALDTLDENWETRPERYREPAVT